MVVRHVKVCNIRELDQGSFETILLYVIYRSCVFEHCQLLVPVRTSKTGHLLQSLGLRLLANTQNCCGVQEGVNRV